MDYFRVLLHIGYPKSASSHIQERLFKNHPDLIYHNDLYPSKLYEYIYKEPKASYDHMQARNLAEKEVFPRFDKTKFNVIADERFTFGQVNPMVVADRLYDLFPKANVLVVLRNQFDILRSLYDMHPYNYYSNERRLISFSDWLTAHEQHFDHSFLKCLCYNDVINYYREKFGERRLGVFLFETLFEHGSEDELLNLSNFINVKHDSMTRMLSYTKTNQSANHALYRYKLKYFPNMSFSAFLPKNVVRLIFRLKLGNKQKTTLSEKEKNRIYNYYHENNRELSGTLQRNLSNLGYPI